MGFFDRFRKTRTIKVDTAEFPEGTPIIYTGLSQLRKISKVIYEDPSSYFTFDREGNVFRKIKDRPQPYVIPIRDIQVHPDSAGTVITLDFPYLALMAIRMNTIIWETSTDYLLLGPTGLIKSPKKKAVK